MTPQEFIAKFPMRDIVNANCLEDMACPKCGLRSAFHIWAECRVAVIDSGSEADGDHEWEGESQCECDYCHHVGTVAEFTVEGLDQALEKRGPAKDPIREMYEKLDAQEGASKQQ